jgi:hypothetical protein
MSRRERFATLAPKAMAARCAMASITAERTTFSKDVLERYTLELR